MSTSIEKHEAFAEASLTTFGTTRITRKQIKELVASGFPCPASAKKVKVARGVYEVAISAVASAPVPTPAPATVTPIAVATSVPVPAPVIKESLVPAVNPEYVAFGNFHLVTKIIKSGKFFPTLITGLSGNGKTFMVEQAAAKTKRDYIRTNITIESDEDSLIGGFRLINGETVWHDGPVIEAMTRGAVLLLDEIDLGSDKIMCLQSILEGKGYFIKKTGRKVEPAPGFTVFLTANTKGKGNETGKFVGTRVLNEAMLDRISICLEQEYPTKAQEVKIMTKVLEAELNGAAPLDDDLDFINRLIDWAQAVRQAYYDESVDDLITTRRATKILASYLIFGRDRMLAIKTGVSRFNDEEIESFTSFYEAIDEKANQVAEETEAGDEVTEASDSAIPSSTTAPLSNSVPF